MQRGWSLLDGTWLKALRVWAVARLSLADRLPLGIVGRLTIAALGVGVLVLAANFIAQHGVLIERTTQITRTTTQTVAVNAGALPALSAAGAAAPARRVVTSEPLLHVLERFDAAVRARCDSAGEQNETNYERAAADLDRATAAFLAAANSISGRPLGKIPAAVRNHKRAATELVLAQDHRREMLAAYMSLFENLSAGDQQALNRSFKIFGRVVARQSVLQLSADLEVLRRRAADFGAAAAGVAIDLQPLIVAEQAVQKDLDDNRSGLRRAEGDAGYESMRADFAALLAMREAIMRANDEIEHESKEFLEQAATVGRTIPTRIEAPPQLTHPPASNTVPEPTNAQPPEARLTAQSPTLPSPALVQSKSVVMDAPADPLKRFEIAWISAAVLVLFTYIAISTVFSIVRPVRRLLNATARLAKGDTTVRVPRGGIRELDTVAMAFNAMAEELTAARAAARDYQASLELKVLERTRQLQELAKNDPLTGLPNRRELYVLLDAALERARAAGDQVGVYFIDIDNFKYINDSMGHAFGDRVLTTLSQRLMATTASQGFAARLGGDEFTVVVDHAPDMEAIRATGMRIVQAFQEPVEVDGRDLIVSVSVGASVFPQHEKDTAALLKAADAALFRAKSMGRSQLSVFTPELIEAAAAKFTTEQGLRRAIERDEFELLYQPELGAETLEIALVEALLRWRMPDGSLLEPGQFLSIAEESGLIMDIGDWVLKSAIEAAAHWHHGAWPRVRVAVNVTPRQLIDADFVDRIIAQLQEHRLPPRCIEIELTESVLQTGPATMTALKRLRAEGVAIALDDFGTGYSSLASLEHLPLSRIKLDRSLIAGIDQNPRAAAIANAIVAMCQGLGLEITAEGIERPEQFAMLSRHRGMHLQGFLLAHPMAREQVMTDMPKVAQRARELLLEMQVDKPSNVVDMPRAALWAHSDAG